LGDTAASLATPAAGDIFTAASLEAARAYARAQEALASGRTDEAVTWYKETLELDPDMGRAWTGLGAVAYNQGRRDEAAGYYKEAMARMHRMTEREKFRTRGGYFLATGNARQALEENEALVKAFPADAVGFNNLAFSYFQMREFAKASENAARAVALTPKHTLRNSNAALFAQYAGDFAGAEQKAVTVLELSPGYPRGLVVLGLSRLARDRYDEAAASYMELLQATSATAQEFGAYALADLQLYRGRIADAAATLDTALARNPAPATRARLQLLLAEVRLAQQRGPDAITLAEAAGLASRDAGIQYRVASTLIQAGRAPQALAIARPLVDALDPEPRALGALAQGEAELAAKRPREALLKFQDAQKLADTWLGRMATARAYLALGMFAEAGAELDRCWVRRGEATAVFFDDIPTWRIMAPVHYYLGVARAGFGNSGGAAEAFKTFVAIKSGGDEKSPERADAVRRLSAP
jgi:tetratricopeptide (TPR) repeat protein